MERSCSWDPTPLTRELATGHELTRLLENHLSGSCPAELKALVQDILTSWEKCSYLANSNFLQQHNSEKQEMEEPIEAAAAKSPQSTSDGVGTKNSKKRRIHVTVTKQIQVSPETNIEGSPEDGYCWRKYGQKDILGTKYPRCYYRCRHRHTQGCMATKHVQRSDENPLIFNIIYQGKHTCIQMSQVMQISPGRVGATSAGQENMDSLASHINSDSLMNNSFGNNLTIDTQNLVREDSTNGLYFFPSTPVKYGSFPSTPLKYRQTENCNNSNSSTPKRSYATMGPFPMSISPVTSESNLFSLPSPQNESIGGTLHFELSEVISPANCTFPNFSFEPQHDEFDHFLGNLEWQ